MIKKFKKHVWLWALGLMLLGVFIVPATGVGQNQTEFLLLGDNLTGTGGISANYAQTLSSNLSHSNQDLAVVDLTGNEVTLAQLQESVATEEIVQRHLEQAKLIVVAIGYSDFHKYLQSGTMSQTEFERKYIEQMTALLESISEHTKAQVVVGDLYNPYSSKHPRWSMTEDLIKELNAELYNQAWENHVAVAPVYETLTAAGNTQPPSVMEAYYPSTEGQQAVAAAFYRLAKRVKFS